MAVCTTRNHAAIGRHGMTTLSLHDVYTAAFHTWQVTTAINEVFSISSHYYTREKDWENFCDDIAAYLESIAGGKRKPAARELLMRRAKKAGCRDELAELEEEFLLAANRYRMNKEAREQAEKERRAALFGGWPF